MHMERMQGGFRASCPRRALPGIAAGTAFNHSPPQPGADSHTPAPGCRGWAGALRSPGTYQRPGKKFF